MADAPQSRYADKVEPIPVAGSTDGYDEGRISLGRQLLRPRTIVSFLVALAIIVYVVSRQDIQFAQVWANMRNADPILYLLAFAAYYSTFYIRTVRWKQVLRNAVYSDDTEHKIPSTPRLTRIIMLSWFANSILPAKLGDGYRGYLLKRASGVSFYRTMGSIIAERIADVGVLFTLLLASGLIAFNDRFPPGFGTLVAFGAGLAALSLGGLFFLRFLSPYVTAVIPQRIRPNYVRLEHGVLMAFSNRLWEIILLTAVVWGLESARFWFVSASLGYALDISLVVFVALAASLLTTVPFTPAGLGVVEGAVVAALMLVIDDKSVALSIALLDRIITYWSIVLIGAVLYVFNHDK